MIDKQPLSSQDMDKPHIPSKKGKINLCHFSNFLVVFITIFAIFPPAQAFGAANQLLMVLETLWVFMIILLRSKFFMKKNRLMSLVFVLFTTVFPYLTGYPSIGNRYLNLSLMFFYYWVYEFNIESGNLKSNFRIIKWLAPFIVLTYFLTLKGLFENPDISRSIKSGGIYTAEVLSSGIGGYGFIYMIVIIGVITQYIFLNRRAVNLNQKKKTLCFSITIMSYALIYMSNYFTALIIMICSFGLSYVLRRKRVLKHILATFGLFWVALKFKNEILTLIISLTANYLPSGTILYRLMQIQESINTGQSVFMMYLDRLARFNDSIQAITETWGFGTLLISRNNTHIQDVILMGNHSYYLDTIALYGFVGITAVYLTLQPFVKRYRTHTNTRYFSFVVMISVVLLFSLNNATPSIGYACYFVFPTMYEFYRQRLSQIEIRKIGETGHELYR